jgi:hypothetical protein
VATKQALAKAFDAGQAAQRYGYGLSDCPFEPDSDEYDAWVDGFEDDLDSKWMLPGRALTVKIEQ